MNRRGFLSLLGLGAAGLVLDPERLLWVPGQKTFFLPSVGAAARVANLGQIVAEAWEEAFCREVRARMLFDSRYLYERLVCSDGDSGIVLINKPLEIPIQVS